MSELQGPIHRPVLLKEVIELLNIKKDGVYVDCTLGDGGYSEKILGELDGGRLLSMDYDQNSVAFAREELKGSVRKTEWIVEKANFVNLSDVLSKNGITAVDGVVYDLGLSSRQIADMKRGFSYQNVSSGEVDMRMDQSLGVKAGDLLRVLSENEIERLLREYGEEPNAKRIAISIKSWLSEHPSSVLSSDVLVEIIRSVIPAKYRKGTKHPAMRTFQALRIAVNAELENLEKSLASALSVMAIGGRVVVVSYHSLEDRIVKNTFAEAVNRGEYERLTEKPIIPTENEVSINSRAKSAKLRAIIKIK